MAGSMSKASKDVLAKGCELCGDFPAELRAKCHPTAPLRLSMLEDGTLTANCYIPECGREVYRVQLDRKESKP